MLREVKDVSQACAAQQTALVLLSAGGFAAPAVADLLVSLGCDAAVSRGKGTDKIADFNKALLDSSGATLKDWAGFNSKWLASPKATEFLVGALELLKIEFDGSYLLLMQDTATARLLPFWNVVFDRAGILPRYLFIVSDPAEAAEDLNESLDIELEAGQLLWLRSFLDGEAQSRGRLRAFLGAAPLSQQPAKTVNSLAETLQLAFPRDVESTLASDDACLRQFRDLSRRSDEKQASRMSPLGTVEWVSVTHEILRDWAANGEKTDARPVLDAIREAFDEAVPIFVGIGQGSAARNAEVRALEQQLETLGAENRSVQESARRVEEAAKEARRDLQGRISHLESALAQRTAEVDETWESLNDAQIEIRSAKQELQKSSLEIAELRKAARETGQALEEAQEQVRARYSEIVTLTRMLATESSGARRFERSAGRLSAISQALERGTTKGVAGWLERILPWSWHVRRVKRRLEREGLFDCGGYLRANPDVQEAGVDPLRHYLSHGAIEGRPLGID